MKYGLAQSHLNPGFDNVLVSKTELTTVSLGINSNCMNSSLQSLSLRSVSLFSQILPLTLTHLLTVLNCSLSINIYSPSVIACIPFFQNENYDRSLFSTFVQKGRYGSEKRTLLHNFSHWASRNFMVNKLKIP